MMYYSYFRIMISRGVSVVELFSRMVTTQGAIVSKIVDPSGKRIISKTNKIPRINIMIDLSSPT